MTANMLKVVNSLLKITWIGDLSGFRQFYNVSLILDSTV